MNFLREERIWTVFNILQQLSEAGEKKNIDRICVIDGCIMLFDGSTPLLKGGLEVDAFLDAFVAEFSSLFSDGVDVPQAINKALKSVCHMREVRKSNTRGLPSATAIFVYEDGEDVCTVCIGDSRAAFVMEDQSVRYIADDRVSTLDKRVISRALEICGDRGIEISEAVRLPEITDLLIKNRMLMNTEGGYDILAPGMRSITQGDVIKIRKSHIKRVILYTDGFNVFSSELVKEDVDVREIYKKLRLSEKEDSTFNKFPRFKQSDDASVIIFNVQ